MIKQVKSLLIQAYRCTAYSVQRSVQGCTTSRRLNGAGGEDVVIGRRNRLVALELRVLDGKHDVVDMSIGVLVDVEVCGFRRDSEIAKVSSAVKVHFRGILHLLLVDLALARMHLGVIV